MIMISPEESPGYTGARSAVPLPRQFGTYKYFLINYCYTVLSKFGIQSQAVWFRINNGNTGGMFKYDPGR